ncbi:uncharacterized protein TNCV_2567031 [Trichonephila clavipes]|uniref:Uncharacterized protein n=1 Tax=Trichonephila clavipes TaxID=2585209 RepID=A0A8X6WMI6_TRICX|nr:uncharacterized protein TNCV_2567031 [Trichonephila clavipes]
MEAFTTRSPHTNTIVITTETVSGFVAKENSSDSAADLSPRARHHSKQRRRWMGVKSSACNGHRDPKCLSASCLRMVREHTGGPCEGVTCARMTADEAVGCTRAFLTMWRSSRRLVCQGRPEPGLRVNDISEIHWSQHPSSQHNQSDLIDELLA